MCGRLLCNTHVHSLSILACRSFVTTELSRLLCDTHVHSLPILACRSFVTTELSNPEKDSRTPSHLLLLPKLQAAIYGCGDDEI